MERALANVLRLFADRNGEFRGWRIPAALALAGGGMGCLVGFQDGWRQVTITMPIVFAGASGAVGVLLALIEHRRHQASSASAKSASPRPCEPSLCTRIKYRIYAFAALAFFTAVTVGLGTQIWDEWASLDWPHTAATIQTVEVREGYNSFEVTASVRYTVRGTAYSVDLRPNGAGKVFSRSAARSLEERFAVGTHHPIYYNPGNPERSVLQRGPGLASTIPLITMPLLGGALFWWGLGTLWTGRYDWCSRQTDRPSSVHGVTSASPS